MPTGGERGLLIGADLRGRSYGVREVSLDEG